MNKFKRNSQVSVCAKLPASGVLPRIVLLSTWLRLYTFKDQKNDLFDKHIHILFDRRTSNQSRHVVAFSNDQSAVVRERINKGDTPASKELTLVSKGFLLDYVYRYLVSYKKYVEDINASPKNSDARSNSSVSENLNPILWMALDLIEYIHESPCDIIELRFSGKDYEDAKSRTHHEYYYGKPKWDESCFPALSTSFERNSFRSRMKSLYHGKLDTDTLANLSRFGDFYKTTMNIPPDVAMCEFMRVRERVLGNG